MTLDPRTTTAERIEFETALRPRDGVPIDVSVRIRRAEVPNGTELRWIIRDITPQRRAERELRRMNADLELLVAERTRS